MKTKILKMVGIVLGSITAFVGAVVGVLAAMGKFKTPVVYPTVLEFAITEQTIIETIPFDTTIDWESQFDGGDNEPAIFSFKLNGYNPDSEHDVNKTECYLWFQDTSSAELITLCNKYGQPLTIGANNRYLVNCNEPIYYMVNKVADDATIDGKVVLDARSTNNTLKRPDSPMTIWIDRKVESVFVKDETWSEERFTSTIKEEITKEDENSKNIQSISVGVDIGFDFNYVADKIDNALSIKPISKESAKEIELYYSVEGMNYGDDYVFVTEAEINNPNSPLNSILTYEDNTIKFKSSVAGNHTFYIAVFPTYEDKTDYLELINGQTIQNPNYHRTQHMTITTLEVEVEDIEIVKAGMLTSSIILDLYSENDYITLDGISGVDGANDNNLEFYMKKKSGDSEVYDYSRFDEAKFGFSPALDLVNSSKTSKKAVFTEETLLEEADTWEYDGDLSGITIHSTGLNIAENLCVIDYITISGVNYYCTNGVAVYDTSGTSNTIELINAGTYLNFYEVTKTDPGLATEKTTYNIKNDFYEIKQSVGAGQNKSWNIIATSMPQLTDGASLKLGVLVVNNSGKFEFVNYYSTIDVNVREIDLVVEQLLTKADYDITFEEIKINYLPKYFSEFIDVKSGSYNACLFAIKIPDGKTAADLMVDTISNITFTTSDGTYVVVGYTEKDNNGNDAFVNAVRVNGKVSKEYNSCELVMIQLKNGYNETAESFISRIITENSAEGWSYDLINDINNIETKDSDKTLIDDNTVEISAKYILNSNLISNIKYYDTYNGKEAEDNVLSKGENEDNNTVYENTAGLKVVVTSKNVEMLNKIVEFYGITADSFTINYSSNLEVTAVTAEADAGEMIITYEAKKCLSDENILITIQLENIGNTLDLGSVKILSGSPKDIVFTYAEGAEAVILYNSADLAQQESTNYIEVVVNYEGDKYTYKYYLNGDINKGFDSSLFNSKISAPEAGSNKPALGFQDLNDKGQDLDVSYGSLDSSIFNAANISSQTNLVAQEDYTVLTVTIGDTTKYLKIKTSTDDFTLQSVGEDKSKTSFEFANGTEADPVYLSDMVELVYKPQGSETETPISSLTQEQLVYVDNVKFIYYGNGNLNVTGNKDTGWTLTKEGATTVDILIITNSPDGWKFVKNDTYITLMISFDVVTLAGTQTIQLTFKSTISVGVRDIWSDMTLYAGTTIKLTGEEYSVFESSDDVSFAVVETTEDITTGKITENIQSIDGTELSVDVKYIPTNLKIRALYSSTKIQDFVFTVKPNVIASIVKEGDPATDKIFTTETEYKISEIYSLESYKIIDDEDATFVYGSNADALYSNTNNLTNCSSNLTISFDSDGNINPKLELVYYTDATFETEAEAGITTNYIKLKIGAMENLLDAGNELERDINLMYGVNKVVTSTIKIKNTYANQVADTDENDNITHTYKALREYNSFVTVAGFNLETITADNLVFNVANNKFTITTVVKENLTNVLVTLIFTNKENDEDTDYQTLKYKTTITIIPYTPTEKADADKVNAFSGSSYDLLNGIYNTSNTTSFNTENFSSLIVTAILDETGKDITSEIAPTYTRTSGYIGASNPRCDVEFAEIAGPNKQVKVQFTITYKDGATTYTYEVPLTIANRQTIETKYPEQDINLASGTFKFINGFEEDAKAITKQPTTSTNNIYQLTNLCFEPFVVYTDKATELTFALDDIKKIQRATVANEQLAQTTKNTDTNLIIELIAYQNNGGMGTYATTSNITFGTNTINFAQVGSGNKGLNGTLIFKLSTVSGNFKYYYVYIYCEESSSNIGVDNTLEVLAYQADLNEDSPYYSDEINQIAIDSTTTYSTLVAQLQTQIKEKFGRDFNSTTDKIYLYEGVALGSTFGYGEGENNIQYKDVSDETITQDKYFNTITIGLINNSAVAKYCYGTITIYVQPETNISASGLSYEVPNGEFTAGVEADETFKTSPFGTDWEASIVSINSTAGETTSIYVDDTNKYLIKLDERVLIPTTIVVTYTNNETVVKVTYTYKQTTIPKQTDLDANPITIGKFENETIGFEKSVTLVDSDGTYNSTYFSTYSSEYSIQVLNVTDYQQLTASSTINNVTLDLTGKILTFTQTTEAQVIKIKLIYTNLDVDKAEDKERIFTFNVQPGVKMLTAPGGESGLTDTTRKTTYILDADYERNVGSTLSFNYEDKSTYHKYSVGGLNIYTVDSSFLELTFDEISYVNKGTNLTESGNIKIDSTNKTVNFAHSAQPVAVRMTINVVRNKTEDYTIATNIKVGDSVAGYYTESGGVYTQADSTDTAIEGQTYYTKGLSYNSSRNFYLTVAQTYSTLQATYTTANNGITADHINVKSGETIADLHTNLLNKFTLIGIDGATSITSAVLSSMGFTTYGNPNYIEFSTTANANIKENTTDSSKRDITFGSVTTNSMCNVYLNNSAGIPTNSVVYNYQIMPNFVDGLDYDITQTNRYTAAYGVKTGLTSDSSVYGLYTLSNDVYKKITDTTAKAEEGITYYEKLQKAGYVSFVMNDVGTTYTNEDRETLNVDRPFVIGTMLDTNNGGVFTVDAVGSSLAQTAVTFSQVSDITVGGYTNAVQYSGEIGSGYTAYITLDLETNNVELIIQRTSGTAQNIELKISLGGVNGANTIAEDLTIYLSKDKAISNYSTTTDEVPAGYVIDLFGEDNVFTATSSSLTYEFNKVTYSISGEGTERSTTNATNSLFKYDSTNKKITTYAVGADVRATLNFTVKSEGYIIGKLVYNLKMELNMQFVVNGDSLQANEGNTQPYTYFVLDQSKDVSSATKFPININFTYKLGLPSTKADYYSNPYYNVLVVDLYRLSDQLLAEDATEEDLLMSRDNIKIELISGDITSDILTVNNTGITFIKDYTGDIELLLSMKTPNGTYSVVWTIYVTGILAFEPVSETVLENNSDPYNSGTSVELISSTDTATGAGIEMIKSSAFTWNYDADDIMVKYSYTINAFDVNTTKTNEEWFTSSAAVQTDILKDVETTGKLPIALPNVPTTTLDAKQSYLVTYKVVISYLDYDIDPIYVTYKVINYQSITPNDTNTTINVDEAGVLDTTTESGAYYLELFNFKQIYTKGSDVYTLLYTKDSSDAYKVAINDGTDTYYYDETKGYFVDGSGNQKYSLESTSTDYKIKNSSNVEITGGTWSKVINSTISVFNSGFTNIFEFKNFMDAFVGEESVYLTHDATEHIFTLVEIGSNTGKYGINLAEGLAGTLFNNDMKAKLSLVENGQEIYSLDAYTDQNTSGFRLITDSVITANSSVRLSKIFSTTYYDSNSDIAISTPIIGVGEPNETWVTGASSVATTTDVYATFNVPSNSGNVTYTVQRVTYSGSNEDSPAKALYTVTQSYYYITADTVIVPSYNDVGYESTMFRLSYNPDENGNIVIDLTNAVKVWTMVEIETGKKVLKNNKEDSITVGYSDFIVTNPTTGIVNPIFSDANNTLTISANVLSLYKLNNPNETAYPQITATLTVNTSTTLVFDIVYDLPTLEDISQLSVNYSTGTTDNIDIGLRSSVKNVKEDGVDSNVYITQDATWKLNATKIGEYFSANTTLSSLTIACTLTLSDNTIKTINIVVNKT